MNVLVVDDHADARDALSGFVAQLGHSVQCAGDGREALESARRLRPDLVISDLRMAGMDGLQLLAALEEFDSPPPLALVTAYADANTAIEAMRHGACDYLRKPVDIREIHRLLQRIECDARVPPPAAAAAAAVPVAADGLIIAGPALAAVVALADRLHEFRDMPALVEAETGCGKELIAKRIHHGGRPDGAGPFVAVNCAAIAAGLFEAELFGYAAGAFTGASAGGASGRLAQAGEGTIFLDEIGELPLDQQAKLLRVIEDRSYYPVGGAKLQRVAARIVCASNRDLFEAAGQGRFREDLLYRLKVGYVRIPPLRERRDEILPLATGLLEGQRRSRGSTFAGIAPEAAATLRAAPWPGNVRQLRHVLDRAHLLRRDEDQLGPELLARAMHDGGPSSARLAAMPVAPSAPAAAGLALPAAPPAVLELPPSGFELDAWHRAVVAAALERCHGSPVRTASYLGISRKVLYTLRKRYGLMGDGEGAP